MKKCLWPTLFAFFISLTSCEQFISVPPPETRQIAETVFENENTANAAVTGIFSQMVYGTTSFDIPRYTGLYGDELDDYSGNALLDAFYRNDLDPVNYVPNSVWNNYYRLIYQANAVIEGCSGSDKLTDPMKTLLIAEAKFVRAFCYFYLVNLYGDVPLLLTTDYMVNSREPRASVENVYEQIIRDAVESANSLDIHYVDATGNPQTEERVRPNKYAALSLLARIYLYRQEYQLAEEKSTEVIESGNYAIQPLKDVFLKNSQEAIWQIPPSANDVVYNTPEGRYFIIDSRTGNIALSNRLLDSFENGDNRKTEWIGQYVDSLSDPAITYHFPFKYKVKTSGSQAEYTMMFRLAEIYLIRAEARIQQGNTSGGIADLNVIRKRAGVSALDQASQSELLKAIFHERQVELFTEWGHRWLDMKRSGMADDIMSIVAPMKNGEWRTSLNLWPVPRTEIDRNPNLTQNPGYN